MSAIREANKKIENAVTAGYKSIENGVVSAYRKVEDVFIDSFLANDGESTEEARERLHRQAEKR